MSAGTTALTELVDAAARGRVDSAGAPDRAAWLLCALLLLTSFAGLVNVGTGTTRTMRAELRQQARLGVPRSAIVGHLLGETGLLALFAGLIGTGVAEAIAVIAGTPITLYRLLVTAPTTCVIALAAAAVPALVATAVRATAVRAADARRPAGGWRPHARTRMRVAMVQLLETPVRTALGATAVGIASAVSVVQLALLWADHRAFTGNLLGLTVTLRGGGVDSVASAAVIAVSMLVAGNVCWLNIDDRRRELVGMRAQGLTGAHIAGLFGREALVLGLVGSIVGAAVGLAAISAVGGSIAPSLLEAVGAIAICTSTTVFASLGAMTGSAYTSRVRWWVFNRATANHQNGSDSTTARRNDLGGSSEVANAADPEHTDVTERPQCTRGKPLGDGRRRNAHYPPLSDVHGRFSRRS